MAQFESAFALITDIAFLSVFGVLIAEVLARIGILFVPGRMSRNIVMGFGMGLVTGFVIVSYALLGFACSSLVFRPLVLLIPFVIAASVSPRRDIGWFPIVVRAGIELRKKAPLETLIVLAGVVPFLFRFLSPVLCHDATIYHYGAPWHFLRAHKILLEGVPFPFHLPLVVETGLMFPLAFGDHRLASFLIFMVLLAVSLVFMARCMERGARTASWAGPLILLSISTVLAWVGNGKVDPATASFFVLGAMLWEWGYVTTGAIFLGLCLVSKYVYLPLIVLWLAFVPPSLSRLPIVLTLFLVPMIPWFLKSWLATGDPFFPFAYKLFNGPFWGEVNAAAFGKYRANWMEKGVLFPAGLLGGWFGWFIRESLPVSLLLPGILHRSRAAWVCLASIPAILLLTGVSRYALAPMACLALLAAARPSMASARLRSFMLAAAGAWALARIVVQTPVFGLDPKVIGKQSRECFLDSIYTYGDAVRQLGQLKPRRLLVIGDHITYPVPSRLVSSGFMGETPLVWRIARDSASLPEFGKRMKQLGVGMMLYNYIGAFHLARDARKYFPWDDRMASLYESFVRTRMDVAGRTEECSLVGGGFYIFRISGVSGKLRGPWVHYLPGAEDLLLGAELKSRKLQFLKREGRAFEPYKSLVDRYPSVLEYRAALGSAYAQAGRWEESYAAYLPAYEGDLVSFRMLGFPEAAFRVSRCATGRAFCAEAVPRYPHAERLLRGYLGRDCARD